MDEFQNDSDSVNVFDIDQDRQQGQKLLIEEFSSDGKEYDFINGNLLAFDIAQNAVMSSLLQRDIETLCPSNSESSLMSDNGMSQISSIDNIHRQCVKSGNSLLSSIDGGLLKHSSVAENIHFIKSKDIDSSTTINSSSESMFLKQTDEEKIEDADCLELTQSLSEFSKMKKIFDEIMESEESMCEKEETRIANGNEDPSVTRVQSPAPPLSMLSSQKKGLMDSTESDLNVSDTIYDFQTSSGDESDRTCIKCKRKFHRNVDLIKHMRSHRKKSVSNSLKTFSGILSRIISTSNEKSANCQNESRENVLNSDNYIGNNMDVFSSKTVPLIRNCSVKLEKLPEYVVSPVKLDPELLAKLNRFKNGKERKEFPKRSKNLEESENKYSDLKLDQSELILKKKSQKSLNDADDLVHVAKAEHLLKSPDGFRCHICRKKVRRRHDLKRHLQKIHNDGTVHAVGDFNRIFCEFCNRTFSRKSSLTQHVNYVHKKSKLSRDFPCDICGNFYPSKTKLKEHKRRHSCRRKRLDICDTVTSKISEKSPLGSESIEDTFSPRGCEISSESDPKMRKDRNSNVDSPLTKLPQSSVYKDYSTINTVKKRLFTTAESRTTDINTNHKDIDLNFDSIFNNSDTQKKQLHMLTDHCQDVPINHSIKTTEPSTQMRKRKKHLCVACWKRFHSSKQLEEHMRNVHWAKVQPFKCEKCNLHFATLSDYKTHTMDVHGERNQSFSCKHCNRTFSKKSNLKKHKKKKHKSEKKKSSKAEARSTETELPDEIDSEQEFLELAQALHDDDEDSMPDLCVEEVDMFDVEITENHEEDKAIDNFTEKVWEHDVECDQIRKNGLNWLQNDAEHINSKSPDFHRDDGVSAICQENISTQNCGNELCNTAQSTTSKLPPDFHQNNSGDVVVSRNVTDAFDIENTSERPDVDSIPSQANHVKSMGDFCTCAICQNTFKISTFSYDSAEELDNNDNISLVSKHKTDVTELAPNSVGFEMQGFTSCEERAETSKAVGPRSQPCVICRKKFCTSVICVQAIEHAHSLIMSKTFHW